MTSTAPSAIALTEMMLTTSVGSTPVQLLPIAISSSFMPLREGFQFVSDHLLTFHSKSFGSLASTHFVEYGRSVANHFRIELFSGRHLVGGRLAESFY